MAALGVELEWAVLFGLLLVGGSVFAPFEVGTPAWNRILKWTAMAGLTLGVHRVAGHWALLVPTAISGLGLVAHVAWCRRHRIHPLRATPRRRYERLRGWTTSSDTDAT